MVSIRENPAVKTRMLQRDRLVELLSYDPGTGLFRWLMLTSNRIKIGDVAGHKTPQGYITIRIDGILHKAHQLAWLYVRRAWPRNEIDHLDGIKSNNQFDNLRDVPRLINGQNHRFADRDSKTGVLGVTRAGNRYRAQIGANGRNTSLGLFDTKEQAHRAYVKAKRRLHPGGTL